MPFYGSYRPYPTFFLQTYSLLGFSLLKSMSYMYCECYLLHFKLRERKSPWPSGNSTVGLFLISILQASIYPQPTLHYSCRQFVHKCNTPEKKSILCFSTVYLKCLVSKKLTSEANITKTSILKDELQQCYICCRLTFFFVISTCCAHEAVIN